MGAKCFLRIVVSMPLFTNAGSLKTPDSQLFSSKSTPSRDHKKKGGQPKNDDVIRLVKKIFFFFFFFFSFFFFWKNENDISLGRSNRRTLGAEASFAHSDA